MDKVLLVTGDVRVSRQVRSWFEELAKKTSLQIEPDLHSFFEAESQRISSLNGAGPPGSAGPPRGSGPPGSGSGASGENGISLVILDCSTLSEIKRGWIKGWKTRFKDAGLSNPDHDTLFLLIVPEDPRFTTETLKLSGADDVVMNGNDREIFLQKIEILLARGAAISPSYIFRLKSEFGVEMAKDCTIEELSEMEVVIRNPIPIKPGTHSVLHSALFGESSESRVNVQVLESKLAPGSDRDYLLRLRFFGLTSKQVSAVRRKMKSIEEERKTHAGGGNQRHKVMSGLFAHTPAAKKSARPLKIAVIDPDSSMAKVVKMALEGEAVEVNIKSFMTPARLIAELRAASQKTGAAPQPVAADAAQVSAEIKQAPVAADEVDLTQLLDAGNKAKAKPKPASDAPPLPKDTSVQAVLSAQTGECLRFDPPLKESVAILGHTVANFLDKPDLLVSSIAEEDKEAFQELLQFVAQGGRCETDIEFRDAKGRAIKLSVKGQRLKSGDETTAAMIAIELTLAKEAKPESKPKGSGQVKSLSKTFGFDAIIIEARFLAPDPKAKALALREEFVRCGVFAGLDKTPSLYVVAEEGSDVRPESFQFADVTHFAWKIPDRRHILETFKTFAPQDAWKKEAEPSRHFACQIPASIARHSVVQEISEFGLVVKEPKPFRHGVFLKFFASVLGREESGVLARCVASRPIEDGYAIEFVFFGSSDEFQKRIRRHVQEDYARKKAKEGAA